MNAANKNNHKFDFDLE